MNSSAVFWLSDEVSAVAVAITVLLSAEDIHELAHDSGLASMALVMLDGRQLIAAGY